MLQRADREVWKLWYGKTNVNYALLPAAMRDRPYFASGVPVPGDARNPRAKERGRRRKGMCVVEHIEQLTLGSFRIER